MKRRARQLTSSPRRWALRPLPAALMAAMMPMASWAFNIGQVVQGQVSSSTSGNSTNVTVHTNTAIVNTKDSSIRANESVSIDMLSGRSSLLVRDTSYDPTYLLGSLQTNGRVFFLNPNGIVFGSGFRADVGSLVASTLNMSDGDFMKGQYKFSSVPGGAGAITQAAGSLIQARDTVAFVAPQVTQAGTIEAPRVGLAAGTEALLDLDGDGLIFLQVGNAQEAATRLSQLGTIVADGGTVDIQARARETLADTVLNVDGIIRARSLGTREGRVVIDGGSSGVTAVNGVVDVTGDDAGERGGQISVLGDKVGLFGSASLDASGQAGGGTVLVGGNYQGSGDERRASRTYIGQDATIKANAITGGDGGKVIVWSDEVTRFFGTIESQGGQQGGNGGFVEVSGKQSLAFDGLVKLDAPLGLGGVLLLDPQDIRLVASGGTTLTNKPNGTPDVAFADAAGTTVSINVDGTVTGASELRLQASQDIFLETNLTMDNNNSVVFSAGRHISLGANLLRVQGTGTITLTANAANGSGSELDGIGGITTTSGGLIQADSGLVTLSAGSTGINVSTQVSNLSVSTTNSGNVTVSNSGDLTFATTASNVAGSLTATATNSGSINNTAAIAVTGNASFETTTAEEDINLNSLTVGGTLSVTTDALANTGNATIVSGNAINLGTSRVRGNLSITAGGPITNSSTLAVTGTSAFSTTTAPNGITLTNVTLGGAASFNTVSATSQADVSVTSTSAVTLGTSSVRGNLSVRSGGHITQTGALTVSGDTSLRVDSASSDILLGNQANSLAGTVAVTGTLANVRDLAIRNIHDNAALPSGLASMSSLRDLTLIYTGNVDVIALPALSLRNITIESGRTSGTNGTGGDRAITDSGTITATGNASFTTTGAARDIVVDQLNVAGTISVNSNATNGDVVVVNAQDVELATSSVGGNLSVTSGSHITQASGATLTVGGTTTLEVGASNSDILLGNAGNSMAGAITLNQKARIRDLALTNTHAAAALPSLSGTTNLNNLTLNFTTANVTLVAADIDITGNLSVTSGGATGITISGAAAARVKVDGTASFTTTANNASIVANKLAVTDAIAVNTTGPTGNATVVNDTAIKLAASNVGGNLTATATMDNISEAPTIGTGTVSVGGNASYTATAANGTITLNRQAVTGSFAVNTNGANGDVTIVNTTDVHLAGSTVGGNLTVTATNGNITDSGTVNVDGNASYTASTAGTTIVLDTQAVDGTIAVNTQGAAGHATIVNATALTLAASSVGGNLTATATLGNLTDGGTITVGGNASFTTSENNANILANQLAVTGRLAANTTGPTGNATLVNTKDVELAASRVGGNLTVTASTGGISDSGTVAVGGNASYTNTIAGNTITLNQQDVDGSFTLSALGSGANVTIVNANGVALATSGIGGNLDVTATDGNITDTGTITVGGTARYIASAADRTITLDTQVVTGAFTVGTNGTNGDVAITNNTGVELAASSIGGDLTVTASNGNITDTGTIVVGGNASYTATTANTGITLDTQNVTGTFALNTNGATGHALIDNTQDVVLATSSVGGNLGITSGSSISQATGATLTVGGTTTLAVGSAASEINLGNTGNSLGNIIFAGTLTNIRDLAVANGSASAASPSLAGLSLRNLTLNFSAANIDLSGLSISGNLAVTSGGAGGITDSGTSTVGGNASFTTTASNAVINLDQLAVTGTVSANTTGTMGHVTLVNASGVNLATSNVGGNLTATATAGNIIDSGTVTVGGNASYTTATANNTITVNEQAVTGSFTVNTNGVGANATIVNATGVTLAASTVAGNLSVTATDGNITDTGTITVAGTARYIASTANRTITLDTQAVMGAFTLSTSGANGDVAITNSTGVALAASTIGGDLSVTAGSGNITDTGTISVGGGASYATTASGATITVGNQNVTGAIALSTNGLGANVVLNNAQAVVLATSNIGGSLEVTSSSHITQASGATLTTGDAVTVAVLNPNSDIELGNGGNAFGGVFTISGNKDNVRDLALGGSTFTSLFPLNNLSNLRNLTLNFSTADITLPSLTILGNLSVTSGGATGITIGGAPTDRVVVRGTASFTTTANNADIVVDKLAVQGTISVNTTGPTGNATVVNNTDINLATSRVGGSLDVTANAGNISDAATASPDTVRVGGNASYTTLATDATITLNEQDIGGTVTLSTTGSNAHVQIVNARTLTLNASTIGGNLNVTALTGDLADGGLITVGGNASYTTSGNDATITLDTQDITGTVALNTTGTNGNASLANATGIDLAASNVGGNLAATATTGNITDVGTITVGGRASYTTSASNATILVNQQAVTGGVSVNTSGALGHATIVNTAGVLLGASNVGGNLSVTAGGAITQNGALDVDGTTTLSASGHAITLTNTGNDFTGSVSATGAAVQITDTNALNAAITASGAATLIAGGNLGVSGSAAGLTTTTTAGGTTAFGTTSVTGNLSTTSAGAVSQGAAQALTVTGTSNVSASGQTITLTNTGNNFTGDVTATGSTIQITDTNALNAAITASGAATLIAGGNLGVSGSAVGLTTTTTAGGTTTFGTTNVTGNLSTTSAGAVSQGAAQALTVTGTSNVSASGQTITLTNTGNNFTGDVTATGSTIQITDTNALNAAITASGAATLIAGGNLGVSGSAVGLTTTTTAGGTTAFGTTSVTGNLSATSAGNLQDSGTVTVSGTSSFTTTGTNATIMMDQLASTGAVDVHTTGVNGHATIVNASALTLDAGDVQGNLSATAQGSLVLTDAVDVDGGNFIQLRAIGANSDVTLNQALSSDTGEINIRADRHVALNNQVGTGGRVLVEAGGNITQGAQPISGAQIGLIAGGSATGLDLVAGSTALVKAGGNITGDISASTAGLTSTSGLIDVVTSVDNLSAQAGSSISVDNDRSLTVGASAGGRVSVIANGALTVSPIGAVTLAASDAGVPTGKAFESAQSTAAQSGVQTGSTSTSTLTLASGAGNRDITLNGAVTANAGGTINASGKVLLNNDLTLNTGTLNITAGANPNATLRSGIFTSQGAQIRIFEGVVTQGGGRIVTGATSTLVVNATNNGSIYLTGDNDIRGGISAVSGTSGEVGDARFLGTAPISVSEISIKSTEVNVAGKPDATIPGPAGSAKGLEGDSITLETSKITTQQFDGTIRGRMPFDKTLQLVAASLPSLALKIPTSALGGGGSPLYIGGSVEAAWIRTRLGSDALGGIVTVIPGGVGQDKAIVFLGGGDPAPAYPGSGKPSEIRVFYNGLATATPEEEAALTSVLSIIEDQRKARFEETVRTENVSSRLRAGVIAEVGAGRPATEGSESIQMPPSCTPAAGAMTCQ